MDAKDVVGTLNRLIETSRDGEYGFRLCAEHVDSPQLKTVFEQHAEECRRGAEQLQQQVAQFGGKPDEGGSASGALHRGWVSARATLAANDDVAMLAECERGEDAAVERYREALQQPLPAAVRSIVEQQFAGVKRNHDEIRRLREQYRRSA